MDKALYTAMSGARATMHAQANIAHNLANSDTIGFRAGHVGTQAFEVPGTGMKTRAHALQATDGFDNSAGPIRITGGELDVALHGNTWLGVVANDGTEAFTRAGEMRVSANGMLTTASGQMVLGDNGPLAIPPNQQLHIGGDGTVSVQPMGQGPETVAVVGRLRLVEAQPGQLERRDDGLMRAVEDQELLPAAGTVLTSGALEGSNVDTAGSLVQMIELSRQFEMQVKLLKSGEENARASTTLLRSS